LMPLDIFAASFMPTLLPAYDTFCIAAVAVSAAALFRR